MNSNSGLQSGILRRRDKNSGPDRTGDSGLRTGVRNFAPSSKNSGPDWEFRTRPDKSGLVHRREKTPDRTLGADQPEST